MNESFDVRTDGQFSYITLSDEPITRTVSATDSILIDLDTNGRVVGIELLYTL